jgi:peptidoglycan/LPS O-acetylase OafA/YrhL
MSLKSSGRRLDFIDSLRGFAALYVMLCHVVYVPNPNLQPPAWAKPFIRNGGTGVTLFFVVSAFTLCYTLEARAGEPRRTMSFYLRRIFRIVPLYYAWLIAMVFIQWSGNVVHHWRELVLYAFFGYNFFPYHQEGLVWASWTLGVEMVFYLIFPVLFRAVNTLSKSLLFLAVSLAASWLQYLLAQKLEVPGLDKNHCIAMSFLYQLPVFAAGMLIYFIYRKFSAKSPATLPRILLVSGICGIFLVPYIPGKFVPFPVIYLMAVFYGALLLGLSATPVRLLVNKATVFIGVISYSLYLNHPQLIYRSQKFYRFIYATHLPPLLQLGLCFGFALMMVTAFSCLTYLLIEQPGIKLGSRLIKHLRSGRDIAQSTQATALLDLQR